MVRMAMNGDLAGTAEKVDHSDPDSASSSLYWHVALALAIGSRPGAEARVQGAICSTGRCSWIGGGAEAWDVPQVATIERRGAQSEARNRFELLQGMECLPANRWYGSLDASENRRLVHRTLFAGQWDSLRHSLNMRTYRKNTNKKIRMENRKKKK